MNNTSLSKSFHEYGRNDQIAGTLFSCTSTEHKNYRIHASPGSANKKEREALIRSKRQEFIAKEQEKKVAEWRLYVEREAAMRRQIEAERQRKIREMREREASRRRQFEDRRKMLQDREDERRKKIMAKYNSNSTSSINSTTGNCQKQSVQSNQPHVTPSKRPSASYAFGSSTPRMLSYLEKLKADMKAYDARLPNSHSASNGAADNVHSEQNGADHNSPTAAVRRNRSTHPSTPSTPKRAVSTAHLEHNKRPASARPATSKMTASMYVPPVAKRCPIPAHSDRNRTANNRSAATSSRPTASSVLNNTAKNTRAPPSDRMTRSFAAVHTSPEYKNSNISSPSVRRQPTKDAQSVPKRGGRPALETGGVKLQQGGKGNVKQKNAVPLKPKSTEPNVDVLVTENGIGAVHDSLKVENIMEHILQREEKEEEKNAAVHKEPNPLILMSDEECDEDREELEAEFRRREQEELAAIEAARWAEQQRLTEAIEEENRRRDQEEKLKEEMRRKQIEAEIRLKEQQERLEREKREVEERARREEEERSERKKRLDAIMQRTRNTAANPNGGSRPSTASSGGGGAVSPSAASLPSPDGDFPPPPPRNFSSSPFKPETAAVDHPPAYSSSPSLVNKSPPPPSQFTTSSGAAAVDIMTASSSSAALLQKYANSNSEVGRSVENILAKVRSSSALSRGQRTTQQQPVETNLITSTHRNYESSTLPNGQGSHRTLEPIVNHNNIINQRSVDKDNNIVISSNPFLVKDNGIVPIFELTNNNDKSVGSTTDSSQMSTQYDFDSTSNMSRSHFASLLHNQQKNGDF